MSAQTEANKAAIARAAARNAMKLARQQTNATSAQPDQRAALQTALPCIAATYDATVQAAVALTAATAAINAMLHSVPPVNTDPSYAQTAYEEALFAAETAMDALAAAIQAMSI